VNIYVGNLSPNTTALQLRKAFERFGKVATVSLSKRPRDVTAYSFCFVEMPVEEEASSAIGELDGSMLGGCTLSIKESGVSI
jgi:RNA-binding protein 4